jgi:hypothetical protein
LSVTRQHNILLRGNNAIGTPEATRISVKANQPSNKDKQSEKAGETSTGEDAPGQRLITVTKDTSAKSPLSERLLLKTASIKALSIKEPSAEYHPTSEPSVTEASTKQPPTRVPSVTNPPVRDPPAREPFTANIPPPVNLSTKDLPLKNDTPPAPNPPITLQLMLSKTSTSHSKLDSPTTLVSGPDSPQLKPKPKPQKTIRLTRGVLHTHRLDIPSNSTYAYTTGLLTINPSFIHATSPAPTQTNSSSSSSWPSFPESASESSQGGTPVEMRICWLSADVEAEFLAGGQMRDTPGVISVEEIPNFDFDSGKKDNVYLQHRNHVIELCVIRGGESSGGSNDAVLSPA